MSEPATDSPNRFPWRRTLAIFLIAAICAVVCVVIINTGPKASRRPPAPMQANVIVRTLERSDEQVVVDAMGSVVPQRQVDLGAQVSGEVIALGPDFAEGRHLEAGDYLVQIDDRDYRSALATAQASLEMEMSDMAIESGNQTIAKREWELIQEASEIAGVNSSLALREPQLKSAEAEVVMAQATLEQAELDLVRTRITAPFNAIVLEKSVDLGSYLSPQSAVASLAGTDTYWVRAAVPKSQLKWLRIPGPSQTEGSVARVYPNANRDGFREGRVIALLGDLDPAGRMARVLIAVDDPLCLLEENAGQPPLLLGDYVRVELMGRELQEVFKLPRRAFRDGAYVWVVDPEDKLEVRAIDPVWQGDQMVLVEEGFKEGERIVLSNLAMPTPGLMLVMADEDGTPLKPVVKKEGKARDE